MRLTKGIFIIILLFISFNPISRGYAQSPLWNPNYNKVQKLIFDNSASGEDLVNFTVLIHLNSSIIDWDDFQTDGDDIRFLDEDYETWLFYEVETWNHGYDAWIWVKIPQIDMDSAIDHIYMYYDNPLAVSGEDKEGTWNNNYVMVQHMVDETNASILDSTQYDNDGTKTGANEPIETINGQMDSAQDFDGNNDYIECTDIDLLSDNTLEAWVYLDKKGIANPVIHKQLYGKIKPPYINIANTNRFEFSLGNGTSSLSVNVLGADIDIWYYIIGTYNNTAKTVKLYIDGIKVNNKTDVNFGNPVTNNDNLLIGKRSDNKYFNGTIDEVRISNTTRSGDWIKAQYLSMTENYITYKKLSLCESLTDSGVLIGIFILVPIIAILIGVNRRR